MSLAGRRASGLLEAGAVEAACRSALTTRGADGVEVLILASDTGGTRYAHSEIIQNIERRERRAYVRVAVGSKLATATTNQVDSESLAACAARALEAAGASREDPEWPGFASPGGDGTARPLWRWDDDTAAASPDARAGVVDEVLRVAGDNAAGFHETSSHAYAVLNSEGISCFDAHTRSVLNCLTELDGATGWGEGSSFRVEDLDVEKIARRSRDKAAAGAPTEQVEPGPHDVVLEQSAVAELLDYLSYVGFGAKQVIEGESFLATSSGASVAVPEVTIADDVSHPHSIGVGFDFEGVPKRRVAVIDSGTAAGPVTDRRTARSLGLDVTGHSSGSTEYGPLAANVVMEPGSATDEQLVAGVAEGLLITRFHYVNVLDRPSALLTGMTRDGTFRIRNGEVAEPVRNLRFSQSVLEAFAHVRDVGGELRSFAPEWGSFGSTVAPALRIDGFHFSSTTSH